MVAMRWAAACTKVLAQAIAVDMLPLLLLVLLVTAVARRGLQVAGELEEL